MKKFFAALLTFAMAISCFTVSVSAKTGDKVGVALNTDIVAYVNHYAVASYAVNGQSCIVAEDLNNLGFDVVWNGYSRTLTISRNYGKIYATEQPVTKLADKGSKFCDILETDIEVFANGTKITSYAMDGYTMIPVEELSMFGSVVWNPDDRTLKLWVEDGLQIRPTRQMPVTTLSEFTEMLTGIWVNPESYRTDIPDIHVYNFQGIANGCITDGTHYGHIGRMGRIIAAHEIGKNTYSMVIYFPAEYAYDDYYPESYSTVSMKIEYEEYDSISFGWDNFKTKWLNMGTDFESAGAATKRYISK